MLETLIVIAWIYYPTMPANIAPVLVNNIPPLKKYNQPLDFGAEFRGKRVFGPHKTIRGLLGGVVFGGIGAFTQYLLAINFSWFADITDVISYTNPAIILFGCALGFGALFGDAIKSFFKRQVGIPSGHSWFPFDQLDFIIGSILVSLFFFSLPVGYYLLAALVALLLHPIINVLGWLLRLKPRPF